MTGQDLPHPFRPPFEELPWEIPAPGARAKTHLQQGRKLRLLEFSEGFAEQDWCTREHFGLVLEGSLPVVFQQREGPGAVIEFPAGAGICIPEKTPHRHAGTVGPGETIRLFLVEKA